MRGTLSEPAYDAAMTSDAVLITGCSTGIGRATAERLGATGRPVYATARDPEAIRDLESRGCRVLPLDVTDEASMAAAVAAVESMHGAVGALVNNAGYAADGPFEEIPMDDVRRQFETNVFGLIRLTQLVLPGMREQRAGRIVNVGSMGGRLTFPGAAYYHATKHAVEALTDALRYEVKPFGVLVSLIQPGVIRTNFGQTALRDMPVADGPYAAFRQGLFDRVYGAYEGKASRMAAGPESVARVIHRAIDARRPRTRYRVTLMARALLVTRTLVPDRVWDAMMRTQFPPARP